MAESKNEYRIPVRKKDMKSMRTDSPAHKGKLKYAVDFVMDEGTQVFAAAGGEVVFVKDDSNIGGPDKKYWFDGNRIVIKHENREYSAYEHLRYKGVAVKKGQKIKEGQVIGYSGNTGYTFGPHLHFEVFRFTKKNPDPFRDFNTLKIRFRE